MSRLLVILFAALCVSALPTALGGFVSLRTPLFDPGLGMAVAAFDDDAPPDVAVVMADLALLPADPPLRLEVFSGDGDGRLSSEYVEQLGIFGYFGNPAMVAEDLDGDGRSDLGLTRYAPQVWLNDGDFVFAPNNNFPTFGGEQHDLAFTDLDDDGDLDSVLLVDDLGGPFLDLGINDGAGNFSSGSFLFAPGIPSQNGRVIFEDMNGDGEQDYVVISWTGVHVSVAPDPEDPVLTGEIGDIRVGDFDEDGAPDIAAAAVDENAVYVLLNDGVGGFPAIRRLRVGRAPVRLAVGDLRGGGHLDIVSLNRDGVNLTVLHGDGTGRFALGGTLDVVDDPVDLALADMDVDGDLDILVLGGDSQELEVLLNPRVP